MASFPKLYIKAWFAVLSHAFFIWKWGLLMWKTNPAGSSPANANKLFKVEKRNLFRHSFFAQRELGLGWCLNKVKLTEEPVFFIYKKERFYKKPFWLLSKPKRHEVKKKVSNSKENLLVSKAEFPAYVSHAQTWFPFYKSVFLTRKEKKHMKGGF